MIAVERLREAPLVVLVKAVPLALVAYVSSFHDRGQDRPGEFGKRMEPYAVDDDGKSLQKIRIVRTHIIHRLR
jgi:hypothetical protein